MASVGSSSELGIDDRLSADARAFLEVAVQEPFVGGRRRAGRGEVRPDLNPATGATIANVRAMEFDELDAAVDAGAACASEWAAVPPAERSRLMLELAQRVGADLETLAQLESLDTGKPIREARGDIARATDGLRFYAGLARQIRGETLDIEPGLRISTLRYPLGVIAAIVPWNVPFVLSVCKAAPALAAGNTVVLKPSETTPLTALRLAEHATAAGFPDGALNVVLGGGSKLGARLAGHPGIAKVTFTGSTETGIRVAETAAASLKAVALELGGKSPHVIFADADLDAAAAAAASGIFYGQGEICTAGARVLIERSVFDDVLERMCAHARALVVGDPLDEPTQMGSLIGPDHLKSVMACVDRGVAEGARLVQGGQRLDGGDLGRGSFMEPTILVNDDEEAYVEQHEIFGPVVVVSAFDGEDEAIARANNTRYGLSAGVWTRDTGRAQRLANALESGVVWVNTYNRFDAAAPLGGVKLSGNAREWSHLAMDFFSQLKTVWEQA